MATIEDNIIEGLIAQDESPIAEEVEGSPYSRMPVEEQSTYNELAYNYFSGEYLQNKDRYPRLSPEQYFEGLRPEEEFATLLAEMEPSVNLETAIGNDAGTNNVSALLWNEVFGENTSEMVDAAVNFYKSSLEE